MSEQRPGVDEPEPNEVDPDDSTTGQTVDLGQLDQDDPTPESPQ